MRIRDQPFALRVLIAGLLVASTGAAAVGALLVAAGADAFLLPAVLQPVEAAATA